MDTIEIKLKLSPRAKASYGPDNKILSYVNVINDDGSQYSEVVAICHINGNAIECAFDLYDYLRTVRTGSHEIFTCSCGNAGCANIWDGVTVKNRRHTVEWRIPKDSDYLFLDKRFYSFSKIQYETQRQLVYDTLLEYAKTTTIQDQFTHGGDSLLSESMSYYKRAYEGKNWYEQDTQRIYYI